MLPNLKLTHSSVFLVSGGAKGITRECVIKLAEHYKCRWILLGRSRLLDREPSWAINCLSEAELKKNIWQDLVDRGKKPTPIEVDRACKQIISSREIDRTLIQLTELGSKAEYLCADVTDSIALVKEVRAAVARLGAITGILHGAGVLADKRIENKTDRDFETVYATKVKGLENLLACVNPTQLDYLILFSSVAGFFGNAGQTDYALANEILNKTAHLVKQYHPSCHVVAINWGPWDSGMVTPLLKKAFRDRQIELIPQEAGVQMLLEEMKDVNACHPQVIIGSPISPSADNSPAALRDYRIRRRLTLAANPYLQEYRIGDRVLLPPGFAVAWLGNACERLYPGYHFFSLEDFKFFKEILFDATAENEYILDIKEINKNDAGIVFEIILWSESRPERNDSSSLPNIHYSTRVKIVSQIAGSAKANLSLFSLPPSLQMREKSTLLDSLAGVENVLNVDCQKLALECFCPHVSNTQPGQFSLATLNPYLLNTMLQSLLAWEIDCHRSFSSIVEFQRFEQFKSIEPGDRYYVSVEIKSRTRIDSIADVTACSSDGQIYSRLVNLSARSIDSHRSTNKS